MRTFLFAIALTFCTTLSAATKFLTISDIHYGKESRLKNGVDTGEVLWETALDKFRELTYQSDFILLLGDLPIHGLLNATVKSGFEKKIFHDLYQADELHKPMFYIPGNNDSLTGNYQPFSHNGLSPLDNAPDWDGACAHCEGLVIDNKHMHSGGYYSSYVLPQNNDLVLLALNATQFSNTPIWLPRYDNQHEDATEQLQWLAQQLKTIHAKQLLIAVHEEPGLDYKSKQVWHDEYLNEFIRLLNEASSQNKEITILAAHSHYDELRKLVLPNGKFIFSYSTPSISRAHYNNSGLKIYSLNNQLELTNFTTYYTADPRNWGDNFYQAISDSSESIFPACLGKNLNTCLSSLSNEQVCEAMEEKHIYGVKNLDVKVTNCSNSYLINNGLSG